MSSINIRTHTHTHSLTHSLTHSFVLPHSAFHLGDHDSLYWSDHADDDSPSFAALWRSVVARMEASVLAGTEIAVDANARHDLGGCSGMCGV